MSAAGAGRAAEAAEPPTTRDRILDVALQRFTDQGFDATSLQEIADQLGFTKAALYYHFRSKEDILMALHMRMHQFGRHSLDRLSEGPVTLAVWEEVLSSLIHEMLAQRPLFLMHERNQAAMERLHRAEAHEAEHEDLQVRLRQILSDSSIPMRTRVRMACSLGSVLSIVFMSHELSDSPADELERLVREAVHDLLDPAP